MCSGLLVSPTAQSDATRLNMYFFYVILPAGFVLLSIQVTHSDMLSIRYMQSATAMSSYCSAYQPNMGANFGALHLSKL